MKIITPEKLAAEASSYPQAKPKVIPTRQSFLFEHVRAQATHLLRKFSLYPHLEVSL